MSSKQNIIIKTHIVFSILCVMACSIVYRIYVIQFKEKDIWKSKSENFSLKEFEVEAIRGNIFDANGNLLATSLPYYEVAIDINAPSITSKIFNDNVDSLSYLLAKEIKLKSKQGYEKLLNVARKTNDRYFVLKRNVSYKELQLIKKLPILRHGSLGGLVVIQNNKRERPFKNLAARSIGIYRPQAISVGLEGAYDSILKGSSGKQLMQKIAGGVWKPVNDNHIIESKNGCDLVTTIDINIQDVAENALLATLSKNNASHGCAILMEVKTGEIKAIANLTRDRKDSTNYNETLNYAILNATEPGSTFKLPALLAAIDDYNLKLDKKIFVGNGEVTYYDKTIKDSHTPLNKTLTIKEVFETSSNVGLSKIITECYANNPQKFISKLESFQLNKKLNICIPGEGVPLIKNPKSNSWSGVTLPQMSYGYEVLLTPLQLLTFYNAIANNGMMVKPRFEKSILYNGTTLKTFSTEVIAERIVSNETIIKAKQLLEGVVEHGTGRGLNITSFKVGGKTGTAQMVKKHYKKGTTAYGADNDHDYQGSFIGYFPANNPQYTCLVVVYNPSRGVYYGGLIAGPVFKEIAEKIYSTNLEFSLPLNYRQNKVNKIPNYLVSQSDEIKNAFSDLNIVESDSKVISKISSTKQIETQLQKQIIPNLSGISAQDAVYLLESSGVIVKFKGLGRVVHQSIKVGERFNKGDKIILTLNYI